MTDELDPAESLALAQNARERIAARAAIPGWYAPLYGLLCGGIVAGGGTPSPLGIGLTITSIIALGVLYRIWSNKAGISVTGFRAGRTRLIAILVGVGLATFMVAGMILNRSYGLGWAPFACGALAAIGAGFGSAAWDRAWKMELENAR